MLQTLSALGSSHQGYRVIAHKRFPPVVLDEEKLKVNKFTRSELHVCVECSDSSESFWVEHNISAKGSGPFKLRL